MSDNNLNSSYNNKNSDNRQDSSVGNTYNAQNNIIANAPHTPPNQIVRSSLVPPPLILTRYDLAPGVEQGENSPMAATNNLIFNLRRRNRAGGINRVLHFETSASLPQPGSEFLILARRAKMPSCSFFAGFKHFRDDQNHDHDPNWPGKSVFRNSRKR